MTIVVCAISLRALIRTAPPQRPEDLKPVLKAIARQRQQGDAIYVYYGAGQAFLFYKSAMGFRPESYVVGRCARDHPEWLIDDVERLRKADRVWVVISHASNQKEEVSALLAHLESTGRQLQHVLPPRGDDAEAYLFVLDPDAGSPPDAPNGLTGERSWECGGPVTAVAGPAQ